MNCFSNFSSMVGRTIPAVNNPLVISESAQEIGTVANGTTNIDYRGTDGYSSQSISLHNGGTLLIPNSFENGLSIEQMTRRKNEFSVCVKYSIHDEYSRTEQFLGSSAPFYEIRASKLTMSPGEHVEFDILNFSNYEVGYTIGGDFGSAFLNNADMSGTLFDVETLVRIDVSNGDGRSGDIKLSLDGTDISCVVHVIG